jgi:putative oxidoreductase
LIRLGGRPFAPQTYALLRIVAGLMFLCHGLSKLFGLIVPMPEGVPTFVVWVAGPIELVGGTLVAIGLFTRPAAFLSSDLMAAAYWLAHGPKGFFPAANQGELAVLPRAGRGCGAWTARAASRRRPLRQRAAVAAGCAGRRSPR